MAWTGVLDAKAFYLPLNYTFQIKPFFTSNSNKHGDFKPLPIPSLTLLPEYYTVHTAKV